MCVCVYMHVGIYRYVYIIHVYMFLNVYSYLCKCRVYNTYAPVNSQSWDAFETLQAHIL